MNEPDRVKAQNLALQARIDQLEATIADERDQSRRRENAMLQRMFEPLDSTGAVEKMRRVAEEFSAKHTARSDGTIQCLICGAMLPGRPELQGHLLMDTGTMACAELEDEGGR